VARSLWYVLPNHYFTPLVILDLKRTPNPQLCLLQAPVKPAAEAKKPKATETDGSGSSGDKEKEDEKEETAAPRRRSRRET
jgi:calnexin